MKARFEGELILRYLDEPIDGKWFEVVEPFLYKSEKGIYYSISRKTKTDFASVPRGFRWLISRVGKYGKAAVLHDWLCGHYKVSRKEADQLFLEAMKLLGVSWWKRRTMYSSVRLYAIATFKK